MKSKLSILITIIVTLFIGVNVSAAECSYEEQAKLNSEGATIKAAYEEQFKQLDKDLYSCADGQEECNLSYSYFKISILNLSEKFYVTVKSDNFNKTFYASDAKDGVVSFDIEDISKVHTLTFNVYTSNKTNCNDKLNRTFYLTTPRINYYSDYSICEDIPDYYMCQRFVTYEDKGFVDFVDKVTEYTKEKEEEEKARNKNIWQKLENFLKKNGKWFIIGGVSIAVVAVIAVVITTKRRKDSI